jgi:2-polyprenyl-3-methyl-5-hydroxy-6-metoxy-1,4-benzoquinol methylase
LLNNEFDLYLQQYYSDENELLCKDSMNGNTICPVCLSSFIDSQAHIGKYTKCNKCFSLFLSHPPRKQNIQRGLNEWVTDQLKNFPPKITKLEQSRIHTLYIYGMLRGLLLDVGCGMGAFALTAQNSGFQVSVVDIVKPVLEKLSSLGIVSYTSLKEVKRKQDCVSCFDVIEHTTDPNHFIKDVVSCMKLRAVLYITTPNGNSLSAKILKEKWWVFGPDGHYILFTPQSLSDLLIKNGFEILNVSTNTLTQWIYRPDKFWKKVLNKIQYVLLFPFLPVLYQSHLGDNIEIVARKIR